MHFSCIFTLISLSLSAPNNQDVFTGPVFLESRDSRPVHLKLDTAVLTGPARGDYFSREGRKIINGYIEGSRIQIYGSHTMFFPFARVAA